MLWGMLAIFAVLVLGFGILSLIRRLGARMQRNEDRRPTRVYVPLSADPMRESPRARVRVRRRFHRFPRRQRIRRSRDFDSVFQERQSAAGRHLILFGLANGLAYNRLGLSVGRRLGNAVKRNRFKRLCREAFRLTTADQPVGWDWVVVPLAARKGERRPPTRWRLDDFQKDLLELMEKISRRRRR